MNYRVVIYFDADNEVRVEVQAKSFFWWEHLFWKKYNSSLWAYLRWLKHHFQ